SSSRRGERCAAFADTRATRVLRVLGRPRPCCPTLLTMAAMKCPSARSCAALTRYRRVCRPDVLGFLRQTAPGTTLEPRRLFQSTTSLTQPLHVSRQVLGRPSSADFFCPAVHPSRPPTIRKRRETGYVALGSLRSARTMMWRDWFPKKH